MTSDIWEFKKIFQTKSAFYHTGKKGKTLTIHQKEWNRLQSKIRIKVEHIIAQIKKFRISSDTFRNKLCRYDGISEIVCGIINFKIRWKEEFITIL